MGTLRKLKMKMRMDKDWHKTLLRSSRNEILIDVDGDKEADVALMDTTGNGDVDTIAVDLTGDGEFNLYFGDTDDNGIPDVILYDEEGNGNLEILGLGKEVEEAILSAVAAIQTILLADEYINATLEAELDELDRRVKEARKQMKKRR